MFPFMIRSTHIYISGNYVFETERYLVHLTGNPKNERLIPYHKTLDAFSMVRPGLL